jgi:hypothetical protein
MDTHIFLIAENLLLGNEATSALANSGRSVVPGVMSG